MAGWLKFKGLTAGELGLKIEAIPAECTPKRRIERMAIPARSGDVTFDGNAYDSVTLTATFNLGGGADPRRVNEWLSGSGDLVLSDSPDYRRKATVIDGIPYKRRRLSNGEAFDTLTVKFACDPFLYEADPYPERLLGPMYLSNIGTVSADPLIVVHGTGRVVLTVGDVTVTLNDMGGAVTIDCDAKCAYVGTVANQTAITLDDHVWPVLPLGDTRVSWSGNVQRVDITPNWRWL